MTVTLRIQNSGGPYTVKVERVDLKTDKAEDMGVILPGDAQTVTLWDSNKIVITELPISATKHVIGED